MANEYIRRQDAIEVINQGRLTKLIEADVAESGLKSIPAADVVPVVRCRDCKHDISSQFDTAARCNLWGCLKPKRGFCDAGKRREK